MGTQILFIDILDVAGLLAKQFSGSKVTKREKKKIKRTFADFATLVPVIILMLLPVSLNPKSCICFKHLFGFSYPDRVELLLLHC